MFKRRHQLNVLQNLRQILWPKMGWWRMAKYYRYRIIRLSSSTESIAANMAAGSAMSFTPFFGIHIFGAMGIAWLIGLRMNIIAATVGSFMGNPWTFPFLFFASHFTGDRILNFFGADDSRIGITPDIVEAQGDNLFAFVWDNFTDVFIPTAIGGTILAILSFPIYYIIYFNIVRGAQRARRLRIKRRQRELFNRKARAKQSNKKDGKA
jgi:uncharacterized protein (DUF2062 family)